MFEWYWVFPFLLLVLHLRTAVITIYLHRGVAHRLIDFTPAADQVFKFLLWVNKLYFANWRVMYAAQHRKHHACVDTADDPSSPHYYSFKQILDYNHNEPGRPYYLSPNDIKQYAARITTEQDWFDKNVYLKYQKWGILVYIFTMIGLFGILGALVGLPLLYFILTDFYIIVGNWVYHKWGYTAPGGQLGTDRSKNLFPLGILFAGEEFHANHHRYPGLVKFSLRWFEFDIGFVYIRLLELVGLLRRNV